jgi:hypothetical protein
VYLYGTAEASTRLECPVPRNRKMSLAMLWSVQGAEGLLTPKPFRRVRQIHSVQVAEGLYGIYLDEIAHPHAVQETGRFCQIYSVL